VRRYLKVGPYLSMPSRWIVASSVWRGPPSFAAASEGPEIRAWLPARAAAIIDGVEDMATVQKSDINPEDVPFCWAALSRNSNEIG